MTPIRNPAVAQVFASYPPEIRQQLMQLRALVFATAKATAGVGPLEETLKWGEPAYLTTETRSGSTVRIGWNPKRPGEYAMYFNCQTTLVDSFRFQFPDTFRYEGNRAILFDTTATLPTDALQHCVAAALTYHMRRKT
jgi:hypothetical protein